MAGKRNIVDLDPDYEHEDVAEHQAKRQRVLEQDAKKASVKRIESIVRTQFQVEIENKEAEVNLIDQRLHQARTMMDRLRAVIIASYYSKLQQVPGKVQNASLAPPPSIHPAVKKHISKAPVSTVMKSEPVTSDTARSSSATAVNSTVKNATLINGLNGSAVENVTSATHSISQAGGTRGSRFTIKKQIVVGNVSKFIPAGQRELNDQSTHKWMVYVRGPRYNPHIDNFVSKVWFFLHPSYRPNDLVEISSPPFHLTRRGWGEFPVRVQLHFWDPHNKRVDIIHQLKLDKTYTGLQTLGAETVVEIELHKYPTPINSRTQSPLPALPSLAIEAAVTKEPLETERVNQQFCMGSCSCILQARQDGKCMCGKSSYLSAAAGSLKNKAEITHAQEKVQNITIKEEPPDTFGDGVHTEISSSQQDLAASHHVSDLANMSDGIDRVSERETKQVCASSTVAGQLSNGEVCGIVSAGKTSSQEVCNITNVPSTCAVPQSASQSSPQCVPSAAVLGTLQTQSVFATSLVNAMPAAPLALTAASSTPASVHLPKPGTKMVSLLHGKNSVSRLSQSTPQNVIQTGTSGTAVVSTVAGSHAVSASAAIQQGGNINTQNLLLSSQGVRTDLLVSGKGVPDVQVVPFLPSSGVFQSDIKQGLGVQSATGVVDSPAGTGNSVNKAVVTAAPVMLQVTPHGLKAVRLESSPVAAAVAGHSGVIIPPTSSNKPAAAAAFQSPAGSVKPRILQTGGRGSSSKMVSLLQKPGQVLVVPGSAASVPGSASVSHPSVPGKLGTTGPHVNNTPASPRMVSILGKISAVRADQTGMAASSLATVSSGPSRAQQSPAGESVLTPASYASLSSSSLLQTISLQGQSESAKPMQPSSLEEPHPSGTSSSSAAMSGVLSNPHSLLTSHPSGAPPKVVPPVVLKPTQVKPEHLNKDGNKVNLLTPIFATTADGKTVLIQLNVSQNKSDQSSSSSQGQPSSVSLPSTAVNQIQISAQAHSSVKICPQLTNNSHLVKKPAAAVPNQRTQPHCSIVSKGAELARLKAALLARKENTPQSQSRTARWFSRGIGVCVQSSQHLSENRETESLASNSEWSGDQKLQDSMKADAGITAEPDKKIMVLKAKKIRGTEEVKAQPETSVSSLSIDDYPDLRSLVRAAVLIHPLIDTGADKCSSPYCATSLEQWLSWKTGKQRASEWMRAVTVKKYLQCHLEADCLFKGEKLWKTNNIMQWCRLHGLSPHGPGGHIISPDTSGIGSHEAEPVSTHNFSSLSCSSVLLSHFTSSGSGDDDSDDSEDIDVISEYIPVKVRMKKEKEPTINSGACSGVLAPSPEAEFVHEITTKMGVKFQPQEIAPAVLSSTAEDMIFAAMLEFASDILQEAVGVKFSSKRPSGALTAEDVYGALCAFPLADFLTNKYCGVEGQNSPSKR